MSDPRLAGKYRENRAAVGRDFEREVREAHEPHPYAPAPPTPVSPATHQAYAHEMGADCDVPGCFVCSGAMRK